MFGAKVFMKLLVKWSMGKKINTGWVKLNYLVKWCCTPWNFLVSNSLLWLSA
jgi:hypothetical protein